MQAEKYLEGQERPFFAFDDYGLATNDTQATESDGQIRIQRGLVLAKKPTKLNKDWCTNNKSVNAFLEYHSEKFFEFIEAKRRTKSKVALLDCVLANLLEAYNRNAQLIYSRETARKDTKTMIQIADYLTSAKLTINVIGKQNNSEHSASFLKPTDKFGLEVKAARVRVAIAEDAPMISVKDDKGEPLSVKRIQARNRARYAEVQASVVAYNKLWLDHEVTFNEKPLVPFCKRKFNHDIYHGGRFYDASHLSLKRDERKTLKIDGEATAEPDFKAIHPHLLYALKGLQLEADPYTVCGFDRKAIKKALLVMVNASRMQDVATSITKSGKPKNIAKHEAYKKARQTFEIERAEYESAVARGESVKPPREPINPFPAGKQLFIEGMPENTDGKTLVNAILEHHKPIADLFGSELLGLKLQRLDADVMANVLTQCALSGIPALPIHDAVSCRVSDLDDVKKIMRRAYKTVSGGFYCPVEC